MLSMRDAIYTEDDISSFETYQVRRIFSFLRDERMVYVSLPKSKADGSIDTRRTNRCGRRMPVDRCPRPQEDSRVDSRMLSQCKSGLVDGSPVSPTYQVVVRKCSCVVPYGETTGAALSSNVSDPREYLK